MKIIIKIVVLLALLMVQIEAKKTTKNNRGKKALIRGWLFDESAVLPPGVDIDDLDDDDYEFFLSMFEKNEKELPSMTAEEEQKTFSFMQKQIKDYIANKSKSKKNPAKNKKNKKNKEKKEEGDSLLSKPVLQELPETVGELVSKLTVEPVIQEKNEEVKQPEIIPVHEKQKEVQQVTQKLVSQESEEDEDLYEDDDDLQEELYNDDINTSVRETVRDVMQEMFAKMSSALDDRYTGKINKIERNDFFDYSQPVSHQQNFAYQPPQEVYPWTEITNENPVFHLEDVPSVVASHQQNKNKNYRPKKLQQKNIRRKKNNFTSKKVGQKIKNVKRGKVAGSNDRALNATTIADSGPMLINAATFAQANRFYLAPALADGNETEAVESRSLSYAAIQPNADNTGKEVFIQSLAPASSTVTVNGTAVPQSPLQGLGIAAMTLVGKDLLPAVVLCGNPDPIADSDTAKASTTSNDKGAAVYLLTQADGTQLHSNVGNDTVLDAAKSGSMLIKDQFICDAANKPINQQIVALAATKPLALNNSYIFAAVADGSYATAAIPGSLGATPDEIKNKIEEFLTEAGDAVVEALGPQSNAFQAVCNITMSKPVKASLVDVLTKNKNIDVATFVAAVKNDVSMSTATGSVAEKVAKVGSVKKDPVTAKDLAAGITTEAINGFAVTGKALADGIASNNIDSSIETARDGTIAVINAMLGWAINRMLAVEPAVAANALKPWNSLKIANLNTGVVSAYGDGATQIGKSEGKYRGVAVLKNNASSLTICNNENQTTNGVKAYPDADRYAAYLNAVAQSDLENSSSIAFYAPGDVNPITHAVLSGDVNPNSHFALPGVDMFWDEPLQRLYIGLSGVTRGGDTGAVANRSGGVCSVLMGKWEANKDDNGSVFKLYPVIKNVSSYLFQDDLSSVNAGTGHFKDYIFGFYLNGSNLPPGGKSPVVAPQTHPGAIPDDNLIVSAKKVRVMHTSTGLDYLIVNGGVATEATKSSVNAQVFAVPLVGTNTDKGYVAQKIVNGSNRFESAVDLDASVKSVVQYVTDGINAISGQAAIAGNIGKIKEAAANLLTNNLTIGSIVSVILANMSAPDSKTAVSQVLEAIKNEKTCSVLDNAIKAEGSNQTAADVAGSINVKNSQAALVETTAGEMAKKLLQGALNDAKTGIALAVIGGVVWGIHEFYANIRATMFTQVKNMSRATDPAATVGVNSAIISADKTGTIQDIQILGDTVFISMAGSRDKTHADDNGIFASTALFGVNGIITGWTPWERIMGRVAATGAFGIDTDSSNIWFVTTKDGTFDIKQTPTAQFNQVIATNWGVGDVALHTPSAASTESSSTSLRAIMRPAGDADSGTPATSSTLQSVLDPLFVKVPGGILHLKNFGPGTNGFKQGSLYDRFSMFVATGSAQIALVQMGGYDPKSNTFLPTKQFAAGQNVFMIDTTTAAGKVLGNIGEITCVELSKMPLSNTPGLTNQGWLFAGGTGGVAVLTRADGRGWDTSLNGGLGQLQDGSNSENFPYGSRWQFLQLKFKDSQNSISNPFGFVRKIVSDQDKFLYIMTATEVWRISMAQGNFRRGSGSTINEIYLNSASAVKIAKVGESASAILFPGDEFYDMMVASRGSAGSKLLLASSKGLLMNSSEITDGFANNSSKSVQNINWTQIQPTSGHALGPVLLLELFSGQPGDQMAKLPSGNYGPKGNMYATAFDKDKEFLAVYRFAVGDGKVTPVVERFVNNLEPATLTPYFYKIGTLSGSDIGHAADEFLGARDFSLRTKLVTASATSFPGDVPQLLTSEDFVRDSFDDLESLDLLRNIELPLYLGTIVKDSASGAQYVAGEFGIRVNE